MGQIDLHGANRFRGQGMQIVDDRDRVEIQGEDTDPWGWPHAWDAIIDERVLEGMRVWVWHYPSPPMGQAQDGDT
jgi:hypothetical protein